MGVVKLLPQDIRHSHLTSRTVRFAFLLCFCHFSNSLFWRNFVPSLLKIEFPQHPDHSSIVCENVLEKGNPVQMSTLHTFLPDIKSSRLVSTMFHFLLLIRFDAWRRLCKKLLNDSLCVFHPWEEPSSGTYNPTTYCTAPVNTM